MAKLNDLIVTIGATTRDFDKALGKSMRKMKTFGKNTKALGKSLSRNLTLPLAGLGAMAVKTAADFEFSMAKVQAVSGFTADEMKVLEEQAKKLGGSTSKSASDVASLQLELAKLGKTSTEIEQMTEGVLSLSIAFDAELGETARVVGATLNQFGLEASESGRIVDNMAVLFGSSALDLEQFNVAMRTVGSVANDMGLSLEETGAALGVLVNSGVDASTAGTALTRALVTLAKEGFTGKEAMDALTTGQLNTAQAFEIFGDRAGKIIPILQKSSEKYAELTEKQLEGSGAALKARKILEDTAKGGFDELRSAVEAAGITIGTVLIPAVTKMTELVKNFASGLSNMSSGMATTVAVIAAMTAVIGPLLVILPSLINGLGLVKSAMGKLNITMLKNPYIAIAAAVIALGAAVYLWSQRTTAAEKIQKRMAGLSEKIDEAYSNEAASMELLRFQYKQAGDDLATRKTLLEKMAIISPETVKDLDAETTSYNDLSTAIDGYLIKLKNKIATQMAEEEMTSALKEQIQLEQEKSKLAEDYSRLLFEQETAAAAYNKAVKEGGIIEKARAKNTLESAVAAFNGGYKILAAQNANNDALAANAQLIDDIANKYESTTVAITRTGEATNSITRSTDGLMKTTGDMFAVLEGTKVKPFNTLANDAGAAGEKIGHLNWKLGGLINTLEETSVAPFEIKIDVEKATESLGWLINVLEETEVAIHGATEPIIESFGELADGINAALESAAEDAAIGFGMIVGEGMAAGTGLKGVGSMLLGVFIDLAMNLGKLAIGYGIAIEAIKKSLESLNPYLAIAAGVGLIALGAGLKGMIAKNAKDAGVPAFADGGIVSGPTMGLVGEYPGAKTNPEVIAPLDKLRSMLGGQNVVVTGKISGRDILITSDRNSIDRNRVRGY